MTTRFSTEVKRTSNVRTASVTASFTVTARVRTLRPTSTERGTSSLAGGGASPRHVGVVHVEAQPLESQRRGALTERGMLSPASADSSSQGPPRLS